MLLFAQCSYKIARKLSAAPGRTLLLAAFFTFLLASATAQQTESSPAQPAATPTQEAQPAVSAAPEAKPTPAAEPAAKQEPVPSASVTEQAQTSASENELRQLLLGKELFLRGGYLDNNLSFNEHGRVTGHSPQGSYTLSAVRIERIHLSKHKVLLEGDRYALHFNEQLAYEDPATAVDRVKITSKKKILKISIDREMVVKPKKAKSKGDKAGGKKKDKPGKAAPAAAIPPAVVPDQKTATEQSASATGAAAPDASEGSELSPEEQLKASITAAPEAERPADAASVTTTLSPAHAAQVLREAIDKIFAPGLDQRMMEQMPDFWKLYYQAVAAKTDYRPKDPAILRQSTVDQKAVLLTKFEPGSNDFAQANGVAGMSLYHTVVGVDGKAGEIAVGRPIGFGLDENAVAAIRKASFQPAIKDGKQVPVMLDLIVQFRIFDKRTSAPAPPQPADKTTAPILPGPYSLPSQ